MSARLPYVIVADLERGMLAGPGLLPSKQVDLLVRVAACYCDGLAPDRSHGIPMLGATPAVPSELVTTCAIVRLLLLDWWFERATLSVGSLTRRVVLLSARDRSLYLSPEALAETQRTAEAWWGAA